MKGVKGRGLEIHFVSKHLMFGGRFQKATDVSHMLALWRAMFLNLPLEKCQEMVRFGEKPTYHWARWAMGAGWAWRANDLHVQKTNMVLVTSWR